MVCRHLRWIFDRCRHCKPVPSTISSNDQCGDHYRRLRSASSMASTVFALGSLPGRTVRTCRIQIPHLAGNRRRAVSTGFPKTKGINFSFMDCLEFCGPVSWLFDNEYIGYSGDQGYLPVKHRRRLHIRFDDCLAHLIPPIVFRFGKLATYRQEDVPSNACHSVHPTSGTAASQRARFFCFHTASAQTKTSEILVISEVSFSNSDPSAPLSLDLAAPLPWPGRPARRRP
jgi:hypothetical protein